MKRYGFKVLFAPLIPKWLRDCFFIGVHEGRNYTTVTGYDIITERKKRLGAQYRHDFFSRRIPQQSDLIL